jgi:hypothetical protein
MRAANVLKKASTAIAVVVLAAISIVALTNCGFVCYRIFFGKNPPNYLGGAIGNAPEFLSSAIIGVLGLLATLQLTRISAQR